MSCIFIKENRSSTIFNPTKLIVSPSHTKYNTIGHTIGSKHSIEVNRNKELLCIPVYRSCNFPWSILSCLPSGLTVISKVCSSTGWNCCGCYDSRINNFNLCEHPKATCITTSIISPVTNSMILVVITALIEVQIIISSIASRI